MLRVEPGFDVREAVQALATAEEWRVRELHRELPNLEDVFVELASSAEVMKGGRLS
jgi:ABC-2 type transport system ATP-binding protein